MAGSKVDQLITRGKQQGFVTLESIIALFPDPNNHSGEIDSACLSIAEQGIEIVQSISLAHLRPITEPDVQSSFRHDDDLPLSDLPGLYLQEIRQIPLLTPDRELELAKMVQRGARARERLAEGSVGDLDRARFSDDINNAENAKRDLVEANLRLVASLARHYVDHGLPLVDLIQEGNLGLIRAVEGFDPRLGYRFSTYATWWIRQAIQRAIADHSRTIRLPVHIHESLRSAQRAARKVAAQTGEKPSLAQVAEESGLSPQRLTRLTQRVPRICSLDALVCCTDFPLAADGADGILLTPAACPIKQRAELAGYDISGDDDFELPPCMRDHSGRRGEPRTEGVDYSMMSFFRTANEPQASVILSAALREAVREVLAGLTDKERRILELRFGLRDGHRHTLQEIGDEYGLTRERIRQIEDRALRKLKHPNRTRKLEQYRR